MTGWAAAALALAAGVLLVRLRLIGRQIRAVRRQLAERQAGSTRAPLSLELVSGELNGLVAQINEQLRETERAAERTRRRERRLKEMIEAISHDLRTPLTAMKGSLYLLAQGELSDAQRERLRAAQRHAGNMETLVDQFWAYSFYSADDAHMALREVNLTNLTAQCIADRVSQFERKGQRVVFSQDAPVFVMADAEYCARIVHNLLQNCLQHAAGDASVRLIREGAFTVLSVRNPVQAGCAIDADRLFERFYTADGARGKASGLGLAVVRLLSERLGGGCSARLAQGTLEVRAAFPLSAGGGRFDRQEAE